MLKKKTILNLHLFDGTGSGTAGAAGGAEGGGADNSGIASQEQEYIYGVQTEDDTPSHSSDSDNAEQPKTSFDDLIKGEYKQDYEAKLKENMDKRFKNQANYEEGLRPIYDKYGIEYGKSGDLFEAIKNDDSIYDDLAYEEGLTPEQYKHMKELERSKTEHENMLKEQAIKAKVQEQYNNWTKEGEELKTLYPGFDLEKEALNPDFINDLRNGKSVRKAYEAAHLDEIMAGALQRTAQAAAQGAVNSIRQRGLRPSENGMNSNGSAVVKNNVNELTDADLDRIVAQAKRGKVIRF